MIRNRRVGIVALVVAVGALAAVPTVASAQARGPEIQLSAAQSSLIGSLDVGGDKPLGGKQGLGWDAQFRWSFDRFSVGLGYMSVPILDGTTKYSSCNCNIAVKAEQKFTFLELRSIVFAEDRFAVYAAGRYGTGKVDITASAAGAKANDSIDANGYALGGGILFRLTSDLRADLGLQRQWTEDVNAWNYRLGVNYSIRALAP